MSQRCSVWVFCKFGSPIVSSAATLIQHQCRRRFDNTNSFHQVHRHKLRLSLSDNVSISQQHTSVVRLPNSLSSDVLVWTAVELSLGIIAGCIATLRPLFRAWGFGSNGSSALYTSGSKGPVGDSIAWNQSRGMHKLQESVSIPVPRATASKQSDMSGSDIELVISANLAAVGPDTYIDRWETSNKAK